MKLLFRPMLSLRPLLLLLIYSGLLALSLKLAYELRFDFNIPPEQNLRFLETLQWIVPLKLLFLLAFGQFGGLLSYFRFPDLYRIFFALSLVSGLITLGWFHFDWREYPPRGVILADFVLSLILITGFRISLRIYRERYLVGDGKPVRKLSRTAIIGAGDVGAQIAADLLAHPRHGMRPVVFLDDDSDKRNRHIHSIPVRYRTDQIEEAKRRYMIENLIIAMPSAPARKVADLVSEARRLKLEAEIIPSLSQMTSGQVKASHIRPVQIEDLLGRDPVLLETDQIREMIHNEVVLVTGAGGSIGSELCRQITAHNPKRLLMLEASEYVLFQIEQELLEAGYQTIIQPLIGNILDEHRMRDIFERFQPTLVFHAAAHKHVYLMERQPGEALKNNTLGTRMLADLAAEKGIKRFVFISTDKAINPTSVMGASKRLAEIYVQDKQQHQEGNTRFMAVRFGNVLGSSGSVIPIFRRQILAGGPVTVTHPDVTRYFMTIPEAVGLVLQSATLGTGGEIYVLDMGQPIKIAELARQMIELSGYRPEIDIEIEFVGLKPGEKLFEEIQHRDEQHTETSHPKIFRFQGPPPDPEKVREFLREIEGGLPRQSRSAIKQRIKVFVPEYEPFLD